MQNIVIVTEVKSRLLASIIESLEVLSYKVNTIPADVDVINGYRDPVSGLIIYTDEQLALQQQALNFLKDWVIADNIPVVAVGNMEEMEAVKVFVPKDIIRLEVLRPLNIHVHELADRVDKLIKQYDPQNKKTILVVDDSGASLRNVKGWLDEKYNVSMANSAAMAIKYLSMNHPDLVLLDYDMPVVNGKQVLEMIRSETEFADVPVIFLTGKGDKEMIMNIQSLKPEGYLLKSLGPSKIIAAVDEFFEERKGMMYNKLIK